ncbi:MAG: hypothetical protein Q8M69_12490 [Reyranella sp.]|nr:hypothetical protein [Reyranella sp.]
MSLNQWISVAVARKIGVVETKADFLKRRSGDARGHDMLTFFEAARRERLPAGDEV